MALAPVNRRVLFVCHPPSHSKSNKKYYTPLSYHLRYLGGRIVIVEYQLQCQICAVANSIVLHDAQYIALVDQHLLGWKGKGKCSSSLLKDEKQERRCRALPEETNRGALHIIQPFEIP